MVEVRVGPVGPVAIAHVAARMRAADRAEVLAGGGRSPREALERSLALSSHAWAGWIGTEPAAIFGVGPAALVCGIGVPWFLGAEVLERNPRPLLTISRDWLARIAALYPHLENYVDARNGRAIRWLRWLGFTVHPAVPYGVGRMPFHRFTWGC